MYRDCCDRHHPGVHHRHHQFTQSIAVDVALWQRGQTLGRTDLSRRRMCSLRGDHSHLTPVSYMEWLLGNA